jgi:hypothetical protein
VNLTPQEGLGFRRGYGIWTAISRFDPPTPLQRRPGEAVGVYPAGSVVQLTDDRFALVVGVNSSRTLRPRVLVHDPKVPRDEALIVDLETISGLGIRRSLKPLALPDAALGYLSPRPRVNYFFEPALALEALQ